MAEFRSFPDADQVAEVLSAEVAELVRKGLAERDAASLIVPGGRTPGLFLSKLSHRALAWDKVQVTGSDERWVDVSSPDSNEALVRRTLIANAAAEAKYVSLYSGAASPEAGLADIETRVAAMPRPFDAVVMGMGDDGHFASLFPGEAALKIGLDLDTQILCVPAKGPAGGPPRLSLTLSVLARARHIYILATGANKRELWQAAADQSPGILPAAALHRLTGTPVDFMWCP
jgi:6-phosphogluconolactonase